MKNEPLVSIIIPTYNSEKTLAKCLESIKNQSYKNIEIIIVDKFSEDRTIEIARKYDVKIVQSDVEMSEARNIGFRNTSKSSKYILFIDSDMELTRDVIKKCVEIAEKDDRIGGIIIPEISVGNNFIAKIRRFERSFYENTEIEAARFFRKELVKKVGGYDKDVIFYEDHTLPQKIERLGFNVRKRINAKILHHEENLSLIKYLKKKYYYGRTALKYKENYREYANKQISLVYRFSLFSKNRRFYSKPLLALGVVILKLLEYFAAGLGFLVGKWKK